MQPKSGYRGITRCTGLFLTHIQDIYICIYTPPPPLSLYLSISHHSTRYLYLFLYTPLPLSPFYKNKYIYICFSTPPPPFLFSLFYQIFISIFVSIHFCKLSKIIESTHMAAFLAKVPQYNHTDIIRIYVQILRLLTALSGIKFNKICFHLADSIPSGTALLTEGCHWFHNSYLQ